MPHPMEIPQYVIDRIMAKRGKLEVFDRFDPKKTALVVIDMQNFFVAEVETAQSIVPNINRLAEVVRSRGGVVAWMLLTVADEMGGLSKWPIRCCCSTSTSKFPTMTIPPEARMLSLPRENSPAVM